MSAHNRYQDIVLNGLRWMRCSERVINIVKQFFLNYKVIALPVYKFAPEVWELLRVFTPVSIVCIIFLFLFCGAFAIGMFFILFKWLRNLRYIEYHSGNSDSLEINDKKMAIITFIRLCLWYLEVSSIMMFFDSIICIWFVILIYVEIKIKNRNSCAIQ